MYCILFFQLIIVHNILFMHDLLCVVIEKNENRQNGGRKRLPDTAQGKLIKFVSERLKEESVLRIQVAKELKEEKKLRWKTEDELTCARKEIVELRSVLEKKTKQLDIITKDSNAQQKAYDDLSYRYTMLKDQEENMARKVREIQDNEKEHHEREHLLEQAWSDLYAQQQENRRRESQYNALIEAMDKMQPGASKALLASMDQSSIACFDV
eukprot:m.107973 g.107973  ORF g.107973 m.107973 type:complete len:211 (+) comp9183_c2_seq1:367-999(+)